MRYFLLLVLVSQLAAVDTSAQATGDCDLGTAEGVLETPDLRAHLFNTGSLFFGGGTTNGDGYIIPRQSGRSPLFAASLWIGGVINGETRFSGARYTRFTYWPGPLNADATVPGGSGCADYDRIFVVSQADVEGYESTGIPTPDLLDWPVGLGAQAVTAAGQPVLPTTREQTIDLAAGERPVIYGGPTAFWVMNDLGNTRTDPQQGEPLGIEVRVTAFANDGGLEALRQATVYRYEVVNRNSVPLDSLRIGLFVDSDLGLPNDDYASTDTTRGMLMVYNADEDDEGSGGYGVPPAIGIDALSGLHSSMDYRFIPQGSAEMFSIAWNYVLSGRFMDGTRMREVFDGYAEEASFPVTRTVYSGDPVIGAFWSQEQSWEGGFPLSPREFKVVVSTPPISLAPGASHAVDFAIVFAQGTNRLDSVTRLRAASDVVQEAYDSGLLFSASVGDGAPSPAALALTVPRPNPTTGVAEVTFSLPEAGDALVRVVDVLGRTVTVVHAGPLAAGATVLRLSAGLAPGVYTVVAESGDVRAVQRLTVMR